jgi:hypothetical protein
MYSKRTARVKVVKKPVCGLPFSQPVSKRRWLRLCCHVGQLGKLRPIGNRPPRPVFSAAYVNGIERQRPKMDGFS